MASLQDTGNVKEVVKELNASLAKVNSELRYKSSNSTLPRIQANLSDDYASDFEIEYDKVEDAYFANVSYKDPIFKVSAEGEIDIFSNAIKVLAEEAEGFNEDYLREQTESIRKRLKVQTDELEGYKDELDTLENKVSDIEGNLDDLNDQYDDLVHEGKTEEADKLEEGEMDKLVGELNELNERIEELDKLADNTYELINEIDLENQQLENNGIYVNSSKLNLAFEIDKRLIRKLFNLESTTTEDYILDNLEIVIGNIRNSYAESIKAKKAMKAKNADEFAVNINSMISFLEKVEKHVKTIQDFHNMLKGKDKRNKGPSNFNF